MGTRLPGVLVYMLLVAGMMAGMHCGSCGSSKGGIVTRLLRIVTGVAQDSQESTLSVPAAGPYQASWVHQYIILK